MVGSGGPYSPENEPGKPIKPLARSFSCSSCGASVTIRYPGASLSAVCSACHSVIDVTDPNYKILSRYYSRTAQFNLIIPLGARGKLKGRTWEVIGYMVRGCGESFFWEEYLLFNPYYGYRWLVQDHGHWSFVRTIKDKPDEFESTVELDGKKYKVYSRDQVAVKYVLGEFYWRVVVDSRVFAVDYIRPPETISYEKDDNEVVWSIGEYIDPTTIRQAFNVITSQMPYSVGVAPNQPTAITQSWSQIKLLWLGFLGILTCAQILMAGRCMNATAFQANYNLVPNSKTADLTTAVFKLEKDVANVQVQFLAPVSNSWFYVSGELVNNSDGTSYPFEQTVEYYSGTDSDGYWSEGSPKSSFIIAAVPAGQYYFNIDTESGDFKDLTPGSWQMTVVRDVSLYANYFWCLFFVSVMPVFVWLMDRSTEVSRWANSDYSPYPSTSLSSSSSSND